MRLDRFLSEQTALSRKEAQAAVRAGAVQVDGIIIRKPDSPIFPEKNQVSLRGTPVAYAANHYFLLHKPSGVITATEDKNQKTVLDLLRPEDRLPKLAPCGRLDLDTTGLLLMTDDGQFAHRMLSPKHHVLKYYLAKLRDPLAEDVPQKFLSGISLREGSGEVSCLPAECAGIAPRMAVIALREGKYHQVKRMFAAVGNHVDALLRFQVGNLPLPPDSQPGQYFVISDKEAVEMLRNPAFSSVCAFCKQNYSSYWINNPL
ncbi:MAG: rRNA pseudouridine synthase [Oscillospiraceae bacterium]|nr:rRNA pseudouridine synthase [Oscillospiraceae bacterium]